MINVEMYAHNTKSISIVMTQLGIDIEIQTEKGKQVITCFVDKIPEIKGKILGKSYKTLEKEHDIGKALSKYFHANKPKDGEFEYDK